MVLLALLQAEGSYCRRYGRVDGGSNAFMMRLTLSCETMARILGEGAYGQVIERKGKAIKTFSRQHHLVQEWVSATYLSDCKYQIKHEAFDLFNLQISMKLYHCNLRQLMHSGERFEREAILKDILKGLMELQDRALAHGDIKPGNILIEQKRQGYRAVLGDVGFVSLDAFTKVERTAATYRDPTVQAGPGHDMYSLAIIMVELLGDNVSVRGQLSYTKLHRLIRDSLTGEWRTIALEMTKREHAQRPLAREVLKRLYQCEPKNTFNNQVQRSPIDTTTPLYAYAFLQSKKYNFERSRRGYSAAVMFCDPETLSDESKEWITAAFYVISTLFGPNDYKRSVMKKAVDKKSLQKKIVALITDPDAVKLIMVP